MKKAILILGIGRSGSSALSGTINILGAYQGEDLLESNVNNVKGYFENFKLLKANDYILNEKLKTSWDDYNENITIDDDYVVPILEHLIKNIFNDAPIISIKDPRLCLLFKFYKKSLINLGYDIYYVRTWRDEDEITKSLMYSYKLDENKCRNIIKKYNDSLDFYLSKINYLTIKYSELIQNTDETIFKLRQYLPFLHYDQENINKIKLFIDVSLKHY